MHDSSGAPNLLSLPPKQPYRINNCKFQNSMLGFLSDLHSTKAYADVVLSAAEGSTIRAHKLVLAAGSSYFNNVLKTLDSSNTLVIALPGVPFKDLEKVVYFIYNGYLDIVNSDLEGFVDLAKQLGVVGMSDDEEPSNSSSQNTTTQQPQNMTEDQEQVHEEEEEDEEEYYGAPGVTSTPVSIRAPIPQTQTQQQSTLPCNLVQVSYEDEDGSLLFDEIDDEDGEVSFEQSSSSRILDQASQSLQEKPFKCEKCGKTYNSNKSLWRHKKFTCDEKVTFGCDICGKIFSRSDNLRRHTVVAHS